MSVSQPRQSSICKPGEPNGKEVNRLRGGDMGSLFGAIDWADEITKAAITFAFVALLGGAAGAPLGAVRHRRELDLASLGRFYDVYGAWFATWKLWTDAIERKSNEDERRELLMQASAAEGQFEALPIKIAIESRLSASEIDRIR